MRYIYTHSQTANTTGYFECTPETRPGIPDALVLFESRPSDIFLFRYIIAEALKMEREELSHFIRRLSMSRDMSSLNILHEILRHTGDEFRIYSSSEACEKDSENVAGNIESAILLTPDISPSQKELARIAYNNIHRHESVGRLEPWDDAELRRLNNVWQLAQKRKTLARASYTLPKPRKDPATGSSASELKEIYLAAQDVLRANNLAAGPEMRHEASLSPIALLRNWHLRSGLAGGRNQHELRGISTAYGRGLSFARARVSCAMEIIERASAYASFTIEGSVLKAGRYEFQKATWEQLAAKGIDALDPQSLGANARRAPLYWQVAHNCQGREVLVPAQAVYLFSNLEEPSCFENLGSTGLAAGSDPVHAKLSALLEILERHAHATMPFALDNCFILASRNEIIGGLLQDYRCRGIQVQFQDITTELGVPAYRCFVYGKHGEVAQATGAGLNGEEAALAALTETPWPYCWAHPAWQPSAPAHRDLPVRFLEDLPDYSFSSREEDLSFLEDLLCSLDLEPVYIDISRPEYLFPVYRALIPGLEIDPEMSAGPNQEFLAKIFHYEGLI